MEHDRQMKSALYKQPNSHLFLHIRKKAEALVSVNDRDTGIRQALHLISVLVRLAYLPIV